MVNFIRVDAIPDTLEELLGVYDVHVAFHAEDVAYIIAGFIFPEDIATTRSREMSKNDETNEEFLWTSQELRFKNPDRDKIV